MRVVSRSIMVIVDGSEDAADRRASIATRLHIVVGLLRALESMDAVGEAVDASPSRQDALRQLIAPPWSFSEVQANYILDMPLARRTQLERNNLQEEAKALSRALEGLAGP